VRFVARLAIAIASLLGGAPLCSGQIPRAHDGVATYGPSARYDQAPPRLSPPQSVEGSWISDDQADAQPMGMYEPQELTAGVEGGDGMYYEGDSACSCGDPGCQAGDGCGGCDDPAAMDPAAFGHRFGHKFHQCKVNDLWAEVHAHRRCFVQLDYLSMWAQGNKLPPLVTTSPIGTPQAQAGVLPVSATTSILFGNERVDLNQRNGGRINIGYWLIDGEFLGIEGQYLALETQNTVFNASSNFSSGDPNAIILARPFLNVDPILPSPTEDSALIAFPDFQIGGDTTDLDGSINVRTVSNIQSANMTLRRLVWIDFTMQRRVDLLLGYRFFRLDDSVTVNDAVTIQPSGLIPLTFLTSQDLWRSRNQFHGGEIGIKAQSYHGIFSLEFVGKCAFGSNRERTWINGFNTSTVDDVTTVGVGGLLTQPTNIGSYRRDVFAILPEANANLRIDVSHNLRLTMGYTFIYINRAQRSGDAIDTTLNPTQIGGQLQGEARPAFFATDTPFWVHGVNGGFEYRW
jgi:hypothetical protein